VVTVVGKDSPNFRQQNWKCARSTAAAPKTLTPTRETFDVTRFQQDRALHRWRQSLCNCKDARLRHRLQAPSQGIPEPPERLLRAFYYTAIIEDQEYSSIRPLIDWLDYKRLQHRRHQGDQGIHRRQRPPQGERQYGHRACGRRHELAEHVDQIVLVSGDGDFRSLVEAVQRRGVRVTVVSTNFRASRR